MNERPDFSIETLGAARFPSPLRLSTVPNDNIADFTAADARVLVDASPHGDRGLSFELAGPRERNFFDGPTVTAGIVTCGGLCPGLNNVVRSVVMALWRLYGVRKIYGFRYGFRGLTPASPDAPWLLTPDVVRTIHHEGGTVLGSSRGPQDTAVMVDTLQKLGVNMLFVLGGDGGQRGAFALHQEITRRGADIAVIGVPKTIDNDLPFIERTFGFDTAVTVAVHAIRAATVEALGAPNGVAIVKLMGRHAGFIAAASTLASREVDLVLVPELPFELEGERGLFAWLRQRLAEHGTAVVVVAEGAGQEHIAGELGRDASGNRKLGDIGTLLVDRVKAAFKDEELSLKYIDPSYIIRAAPATAADAIFCGRLGEDAVHAAMAGKTGMVVGLWMNQFTHVPLRLVTSHTKRISLDSTFWRSVIDCTGQPGILGGTEPT